MKRFRSGDKMTKNETKSIILRLVREIGRIKWGMVLVCVLSALTMAANIAAPKFLSDKSKTHSYFLSSYIRRIRC